MRIMPLRMQDLEQAESNRTQAQADLNAAEQGMRILGIKNPEDLAKAPSSARDSGAGADCGRGGGAAGFAGASGAGRADAGIHHLGPEHSVGAGQRVPGRSCNT